MRHNDRNIIIIFVNFKKVIIVRNDKICSLCADGKIRNRNFLTWQTILPSPLSLWLLGYHLRCNGMEWNGNGYGTRIGHYGLDWALGSGGSMMTDDDDVSPYFLPTDTLVRSSVLTHVLYRVLHGSPPSWWWWWMTVCGGDRLMRRLLDVDTPTSLLLGHNGISRSTLQRQRWPTTWPTYVWWPLTTRNLSTCEPQRLRLLWSNQLVNRRSTLRPLGKLVLCRGSSSWNRTHWDWPSDRPMRSGPTKRCTPHHWLGPLLARAADTDSTGPYVEPTTALRRGRRRRPPCLPIRRHPGK